MNRIVSKIAEIDAGEIIACTGNNDPTGASAPFRDQPAGGLRAAAVRGTMIFVSHDRMFLRGLGSRVLELGGESGTDRNPLVYPGTYVEYVQRIGHEAPGIYS